MVMMVRFVSLCSVEMRGGRRCVMGMVRFLRRRCEDGHKEAHDSEHLGHPSLSRAPPDHPCPRHLFGQATQKPKYEKVTSLGRYSSEGAVLSLLAGGGYTTPPPLAGLDIHLHLHPRMSDRAAPATLAVYKRFPTKSGNSARPSSAQIAWDPRYLASLGLEPPRKESATDWSSKKTGVQLQLLLHRTRFPASSDVRRSSGSLRAQTAPLLTTLAGHKAAAPTQRLGQDSEEKKKAARARFRADLERIFSLSLVPPGKARVEMVPSANPPAARQRPQTAGARMEGGSAKPQLDASTDALALRPGAAGGRKRIALRGSRTPQHSGVVDWSERASVADWAQMPLVGEQGKRPPRPKKAQDS